MKMKISVVGVVLLILTFYGEVKAQDTIITTSDNVRLFASVRGAGIPCLFIHGGPGQGSNYWQALAGNLSEKHFKMIYLDQRGCGRSSSPSDSNYSIDRMIQDFEEVREHLGIKEWMIMGHSFGGVLQTYYGKKHSEVIKGILMFNCTLDMYSSIEQNYIPSVIAFFDIDDKAYFTNEETPLIERLDSIQQLFSTKPDAWKLSFSSVESAIKFGQTYAGFDTWNMDFSKAAFMVEDYEIDYSKMTPDIDIPTLFLYTTQDKNVGVKHYRKVKFPNIKLVKVEGGHMEFIDKPADYNIAVDDFLNEYFKTGEF